MRFCFAGTYRDAERGQTGPTPSASSRYTLMNLPCPSTDPLFVFSLSKSKTSVVTSACQTTANFKNLVTSVARSQQQLSLSNMYDGQVLKKAKQISNGHTHCVLSVSFYHLRNIVEFQCVVFLLFQHLFAF